MDCFGSSDEEEEECLETIKRDESCGICTFHPHTESSLLSHVRNRVQESSKDRKAEQVLNAIDEFCISRHWMMNVGPEKGSILTSALKESIDNKLSSTSESSHETSFVVVELGSYCGYSSMLMAKHCLESYNKKMLDLKVITLEINPEYIKVANELIKLSGLDDVISLSCLYYNGHDTNMIDVLQEQLKSMPNEQERIKSIDFLFIDHDKDSYKSDLVKIEAAGLIRRGTRCVADNVVFAGIHDYLEYVKMRQNNGVVVTNTISCLVEYSNNDSSEEVLDGIGENADCYLCVPFPMQYISNLFLCNRFIFILYLEITDYCVDP